jgi:hypothetical protein
VKKLREATVAQMAEVVGIAAAKKVSAGLGEV